MSRIWALVVAQWRTMLSYRLQSLFSLAGLIFSVIPLFFIAKAVEPVMAKSIASEGGDAFGFLLIGTLGIMVVAVAMNTLPSAIGSGIRNGIFEALLATPTSSPVLVAGLSAYALFDVTVRAIVLLVAGSALGANLAFGQFPVAIVILGLLILAHFGVGLIGAAMILAFRTAGPVAKVVLLASTLLGGVYYPTHVIPSWLQSVSAILPLSYGLRALRRVLLQDASFTLIAPDLLALSMLTAVLFGLGAMAFSMALRHARHQGTLTQY